MQFAMKRAAGPAILSALTTGASRSMADLIGGTLWRRSRSSGFWCWRGRSTRPAPNLASRPRTARPHEAPVERAIRPQLLSACRRQGRDSPDPAHSYIDRDAGAPSRTAWTPVCVEERLRKAAAMREALSSNDTEITSGAESIGIIGGIGVTTAVAAGDSVVAEAAEALSWLSWLDPDDAGIVLARLEGAPWKSICWRFDISRPTADRRWRYALSLIAWRLSGQAPAGSCRRRRRAAGPTG